MHRSISRRSALVCAVAAAAFVTGAVSATWLSPRDAQAQVLSGAIQVPRDGLTFRAADGHAIARLSYDARGGTFEVLDDHGETTAVMGPGGQRGRANLRPVTAPTTVWSIDEVQDPWATGASPRGARDDYAQFGERR